jgi:hypothetical protein
MSRSLSRIQFMIIREIIFSAARPGSTHRRVAKRGASLDGVLGVRTTSAKMANPAGPIPPATCSTTPSSQLWCPPSIRRLARRAHRPAALSVTTIRRTPISAGVLSTMPRTIAAPISIVRAGAQRTARTAGTAGRSAATSPTSMTAPSRLLNPLLVHRSAA